MAINNVPSSLPDPKYIRELESVIAQLVRQQDIMQSQLDELRQR